MAEKKDKEGKDAKKKGKKGATPVAEGTMSLAAHPRAVRRVAQAKGWGGLLGFLAGGYLSLSTHTPRRSRLPGTGGRGRLLRDRLGGRRVPVASSRRRRVAQPPARASAERARKARNLLRPEPPDGPDPSHHPQAPLHSHRLLPAPSDRAARDRREERRRAAAKERRGSDEERETRKSQRAATARNRLRPTTRQGRPPPHRRARVIVRRRRSATLAVTVRSRAQ